MNTNGSIRVCLRAASVQAFRGLKPYNGLFNTDTVVVVSQFKGSKTRIN